MQSSLKQRSKQHVDYSKEDVSHMKPQELSNLLTKLEQEALVFETRFERYLRSEYQNDKKTHGLFKVANILWQRIANLEKQRLRNGQRQ